MPQSPTHLLTEVRSSVIYRRVILPTKSPTDCANYKGQWIKCISDRVSLLTKLSTDSEKYGG